MKAIVADDLSIVELPRYPIVKRGTGQTGHPGRLISLGSTKAIVSILDLAKYTNANVDY